MKTNESTRSIILSILLITGFVINAGYVVRGQADNELDRAISVEMAEEWTVKGMVFALSGEYEKAMGCFNKAIELDPNNVDAYGNRGITYRHLKQYERAIEDYTKVIELDPNSAIAYYNRGITYRRLNQYERAIEDYTKAIELNPNLVAAYINRGCAYYDLREYERAIGDFNKAIELDPNAADAYYYRDRAIDKSKGQKITPGQKLTLKQTLTPGFEALFAITGFLAVAYLSRRRN